MSWGRQTSQRLNEGVPRIRSFIVMCGPGAREPITSIVSQVNRTTYRETAAKRLNVRGYYKELEEQKKLKIAGEEKKTPACVLPAPMFLFPLVAFCYFFFLFGFQRRKAGFADVTCFTPFSGATKKGCLNFRCIKV